MAVKIFIRRQMPEGKENDLFKLIREMRAKAIGQPGYISGETLIRVDDPSQFLVVSTWRHIDDWKKWEASEERKSLQRRIDEILGKETQYEVYHYLEEKMPATLASTSRLPARLSVQASSIRRICFFPSAPDPGCPSEAPG
ncbi:MAG: antibiotic biosynthesis monooxygenase [Syntrophales bacterium]|nr:antibiotic biosynthesis monooxygenase [Syntrophales bacterium]